jgi:hypothetical protein
MALAMLPAVAVQAVRVPETLSHRGSATAGPVVPGFAIDHLGVLFDDRGNGEVQAAHGAVRFRHDGTWGDWIPLTKDDASGKGLWASALVAGDGAEAFQVRGIPAGAGSPRTVAFNTSDGPLRTTGARTGGAAATNNCMSRAEWGADESLRMRPGDTNYEPVPFSDAQVMTLHHTATSNLDDNPAGTVRAIYEYHTVDNGWQDIGYHYLISEDGTVFEGRWSGELGDTYELDGINPDTYSQRCDEGGTGADFAHQSTDPDAFVVRGAHVGGYNTGNLGIALIGSFADRGRYSGEPTDLAVSAAEDLLVELTGRHGIDADGTVNYVNDTEPDGMLVDAISGHRDWPDNVTECPGDNLYALLPQIRANVADPLEPTDSPPTVTLTSPADGATVSAAVTLTANASDDDGVDHVEFFVDNDSIEVDADGVDGWSATWDTTLSAEGEHEVTATTTDTADQTASDSITVTVANEQSTDPTVHVGDLDATSTSQGQKWIAYVTITVVDSDETPVSEATVSGSWSIGGTSSCVTEEGTCTVDLSGIFSKRTTSVDFAVTGVTGSLTYQAGDNVDPDEDSDGTVITVDKP